LTFSFNSLFGILAVQTRRRRRDARRSVPGFNSLFGILAVQTTPRPLSLYGPERSFNSLFGILAVQTQARGGTKRCYKRCFNSLFGILAVQTLPLVTRQRHVTLVSIPCSEFWLFRRDGGGTVYIGVREVSIPCSEFWLFRRHRHLAAVPASTGFNSLFGILAVQTTRRPGPATSQPILFQFPVRNSGCSDVGKGRYNGPSAGSFNSLFGILAVQT